MSSILTVWLELQPKGTRGLGQITHSMEEWFLRGAQHPKMERIAEVYKNTLGADNSIDYIESLTDLLTEVRQALSIAETQLDEGSEWIEHWD